MIDSKLTFLTWLAIANTTISSHRLLSVSNTNAMLLPREMLSTFHLDNLKFTKVTNIISYQNLLLSRCITDQLSFFRLKSYGTLSLESSIFREGKFEAIGKNVHVVKSKFYMKSNNFFKVENSAVATYKFADFSSKTTSKPVLVFNNVKKINIDICNFTNVAAGALKTTKSELTKIYFGVFNKCQSDIGGAIYSDSKEFFAEQSYFVECSASKTGGSLYFTRNNLNSKIITTYFVDNMSPAGNSIVNEGQLEVLNCIFTNESQREVIGSYKSFSNQFSFNKRYLEYIPTPSDTATQSYLPIPTVEAQAPIQEADEIPLNKILIAVAIAVVCVIVVVLIGFFIYWRMKKQRNTIYASDNEVKDENEMGTVEIKSKYTLSKVYSSEV